MKKMNKKGFTLIEMLAVIAIIAVLVAIIVPAVGSSTTKAKAATNAANLRNAAATYSIAYVNGEITAAADGTLSAPKDFVAPTAETVTGVAGGDFTAKLVGDEIVCTFGASTIADYADVAEDGVVGEAD